MSHNVLRAALVGLRSWGSIKKAVFVMKMAVIISVENLKTEVHVSRYPGRYKLKREATGTHSNW